MERHVDSLPTFQRVVAVCAHPDDESFGLGAIIATFVERDTIVEVICLTRGEASTLYTNDGALDERRHAELVAATDELGIEGLEVAHFPDGALDTVDRAELHGFIRPIVEGADALLVFDEGGITGHPDHQAATRAALAVADDLDIAVLAWALPAAVARRLNTSSDRDSSDATRTRSTSRSRSGAPVNCVPSRATTASWRTTPVPKRRLELTGDIECLRYLRNVRTTPPPRRR